MSQHKSTLEIARDELFAHIHRCGVLKATPEQQDEWMDDTMGYMEERFPDLSADEISELHVVGTRFCRPVIAHGRENTALTQHEEHGELAAAG